MGINALSNDNILWSVWIFRDKQKLDGSFELYKAQIVGDGVGQQTSVDLGETLG